MHDPMDITPKSKKTSQDDGGAAAIRLRMSAAGVAQRPTRFSDLSAPRQVLMRLCQSLNHGQILDLHVIDREPTFHPPPTVLWDIRLDADGEGRPEAELADFPLRAEVCRLLDALDATRTGRIERIEVRAGIPRRVLISAKLTEVDR